MDRRSALILGIVFGGFVLVAFGVFFVAYSFARGGSGGALGGPKIGVVEIKGPIVESDDAVEHLHRFLEDDSIRAVVVRVDSPGGAVAPSQEIATEVRRVAAKKKVVVSMGNVAASGGYYLAVSATRIVANPGTITGSIGVITQIPNFREIADKVGFEVNTVKSGPAKDIGNPFRAFTEEDRAIFQAMIDGVYRQFVQAVAEGRGLPEEEVRKVADGRVLTGEEAKSLGLVDDLGNFRDAVSLAASLAGIEGEPHLVYPPEEHELSIEAFLTGGVRAMVKAAFEEVRVQAGATSAGPQYLLPGY